MSESKQTKILLSYRRDDAEGYAGRIYDRLVAEFGESRVFMDVDEMAPGANFLEVIERSLEESAVFVAVIGTNWRGPLSTGGQRIDQPGDFVRHEVSRALEREDVLVVPVLVRGARMAAASELPGELRALASLHAHELTHPRWNYDLDRLVSRVRESLPSHDTASRDLNSVLRSMRSDFQFLTRVFMQRPTLTISAFVLALCWIWLSATGPVLAEAGIDVPVVPHSLPERFVLTDLTTDAVSLRVQGVRSHVTELLQRNDLEYPLNLSAANLGESWYEVNELLVSLPDGIRVVSRAPSQIRAKFDLRSQRFVPSQARHSRRTGARFHSSGGLSRSTPCAYFWSSEFGLESVRSID